MNTTVLPNMIDRDPATMPLEEIDISYIDLGKRRQVALFQTPARRSACALLPQQRIRRVLVDHAFRRHWK